MRILSFRKSNTASFPTNIIIHWCLFHLQLVKWMASLWGHAIQQVAHYFFLPFSFPPLLPSSIPSTDFMASYMTDIILDTGTTVMNQRDKFVTSWGLQSSIHPERHTGCRNNGPGPQNTQPLPLMVSKTLALIKLCLSLCWALTFEFA